MLPAALLLLVLLTAASIILPAPVAVPGCLAVGACAVGVPLYRKRARRALERAAEQSGSLVDKALVRDMLERKVFLSVLFAACLVVAVLAVSALGAASGSGRTPLCVVAVASSVVAVFVAFGCSRIRLS